MHIIHMQARTCYKEEEDTLLYERRRIHVSVNSPSMSPVKPKYNVLSMCIDICVKSVKRDLLECQKRPPRVSKETY